MIKVIALDLVGVLVKEVKELDGIEDKIERFFGPNKSDEDFINQVKEITNLSETEIINITKNIINKLYGLKDKDIVNKLKEKYPDIKLVIATNHVSYIKEYIKNNIDIEDIIISADIGKIKPNHDFYYEVANTLKEEPKNILFIDDNQNNIDGAKEIGMQAIKIEKYDDVFDKIREYLED